MKLLENILHTSKLIAIISFVLGTCLLVSSFLFPREIDMLIFGLYYVGFAALVNAILFALLVVMAFVHWNHRAKILKTCGLMLLNIPIAIGYFFIVINFINF